MWSTDEIECYQEALCRYNKDFHSVARRVGSKSVKQCIEFYYVWKKVCPDEYKRLRLLRRRRGHSLRSRDATAAAAASATTATAAATDVVTSSSANVVTSADEREKTFRCLFDGCSAVSDVG